MECTSAADREISIVVEGEIAARLERATRSVLASSSLASYSYSESSAREDLSSQIPALADLLTHKTDFGAAEEGHFPDQDAIKFVSSSLTSGETGVPKGSLDGEDPFLDMKTSSKEPTSLNAFPHTSKISSAETEPSTHKHSSILDYSAKLEGISLDDFFSNQIKQELPTPSNSNILSVNASGLLTAMDTPGIQVRKDSLFWDPLSETIIPDGFDMMATTSELITSKNIVSDKVIEGKEDDDPFSSWEGDFQSAPSAIRTEASASHISEAQSFVQPGELEDFFGNFESTKVGVGGESVGLQGNNGWANNAENFGMNVDSSDGRNLQVDDLFFGSEWQQSAQSTATIATNNSQSTISFNGDDVFGPFPSPEKEIPQIREISLDSLQAGNSTATVNQPLTEEPQESQAAGGKNKIVESLLAQLHDLSFMLTDKLMIMTEDKST